MAEWFDVSAVSQMEVETKWERFGIRIADALDDAEVAFFEQGAEEGHRAVQADVVAEFDDVLFLFPDARAGLVIGVVGIGDERVQSVVSTGELEDDEDGVVLAGDRLDRQVAGAFVELAEGALDEHGDGPGGGCAEDGGAEKVAAGFHVDQVAKLIVGRAEHEVAEFGGFLVGEDDALLGGGVFDEGTAGLVGKRVLEKAEDERIDKIDRIRAQRAGGDFLVVRALASRGPCGSGREPCPGFSLFHRPSIFESRRRPW